MARQISLDEIENLQLINDTPIRFLFLAEAFGNLVIILIIFLYPSSFLAFLLKPEQDITPLATHVLFWWNSWIIVMTGLLLAAVPSKYNTPTLTAGLVHVRRFLYWALLASEVLLIFLLNSPKHRTNASIGSSIFCLLVIIGRLIVLFPLQEWFGTVLIELPGEKKKQ